MRDYPLISDYIDAIKAAEDNFEQLKHLRPVLGADGNPVMSSGNFAVVFKMKDEISGNFYAVKCFLKEQEGREEAYHLISDELNAVNSPYLTPIRYLDKELFVDSRNTEDTEFPVLLMDWVEGTPLDKYIQVYVSRYQRAEELDEVTDSQEKTAELIANAYELDKLSYQFSRLAVWLLKQPFAHGDLKPDNIMVKENGVIVLVDYDGMYVPAMKGQKARELGSPDFRHPLRTIDDFDEHIDDFPLASILLSLLAIATRPALFDEFGDDGRLLFTENDYRNLAGSNVLDAIKPLIEDKNLTTYLSLFYLCSAQKSLFKESYHLFYLPEPIKPSFMEDENMSTKVTRNDLVHPWMDVYGYDETESYKDEEYGLLYDEDKRRLLRCSFQITICTIIEGTKIICDHAFLDRNILSVQIPESVMAIGKEAFCHCHRLESITIPEGVHMIGDYAFANCYKLATIHLPESLNVIGDDIFYNCNRLSGIYIPKGFKSIYEALLPDYKSIIIEEVESEDLSTEVTEEDLANTWTDESGVKYSADRKRLLKTPKGLDNYIIKDGTIVICDYAFAEMYKFMSSFKNSNPNYKGITTITLPNGIKKIGKLVFFACSNLNTIYIPAGARQKYEEIMPHYKEKFVEQKGEHDPACIDQFVNKSNISRIFFDNSIISHVERCHVYKRNEDWVVQVVFKYGMTIVHPYSLLQGNQDILLDKQSIEKLQLYVGYCDGVYINPKAIKIDYESPSTFTAQILFNSDNIEISGITWGLYNNINDWRVKGIRSFNIEERLAVSRAEVVASKYGNSVCFYMTSGGQTYIPLDSNSTLSVGDELNMNTAKLITLCRKGNDDIVRVME